MNTAVTVPAVRIFATNPFSRIVNCLHISVFSDFTGLSALESDPSTSVRIHPFENDARV